VYRSAGWSGVLPLPARQKHPPPVGFTGWLGKWPTDIQIEVWRTSRANGNLLVRAEPGMLGFDVDAYDDKTGGRTLKEGESRWGPRPPTYRNSSKPDDPVSGHLIYRVPEDFRSVGVLKFPESEIGDVEMVQRHHRFFVCWPSVHPKTGSLYRWYGPDGEILPEGEVPSPEDAPELPQAWLDGLRMTLANRRRTTPQGQKPDEEELPVYDVLRALTDGRPTPKVSARMTEALYDVRSGQSRHDTMRDHVMGLLRYGTNGEPGVQFVMRELRAAFVEVAGKDRPRGDPEAMGEFERFITNAGHLLDDDPTGGTGELGWPSPQAPRQVAVRVAEHYATARQPLAFWAQQWFRWDGTAYQKLEDTEFRGDLYRLLEDTHYYNAKGDPVPWNPDQRKLGNALDAMKAPPVLLGPRVRPQTWITGDGEPVIACANGLLRIADRTLLEPTPEFFNTFALPFDFDADARSPSRWLQFLDEILSGDAEAVAALQEWFGYVLSGRTDLQKALMLLGRTRSGKGTVDKVLAALVGSANHTGLAGSDLAADFGLEQLVTKTVATFSDDRMSMNGKRFVERLLRITGEDVVTVTQKYRSAWTGQLGVRLQFMSNEPPALPDASGAIVGRLVVIYLPTCWLGREDIGLVAKLHAELPGILNWSLDGLERLTATGRFTVVSSSAGLIDELHESASPIHTFVGERCVTGATRSVGKDQLYLAWRQWCADNGHEAGAKTGLTKKLVAALGRDVIDPGGRERRAKQKQIRIYRGIDLPPSARREIDG